MKKILALFFVLFTVCTVAYAADGVASCGNVCIKGTLPQDSNISTIMGLKKTADVNSVNPEDIVFLDELRTTDGENFTYKFSSSMSPSEYNVYVYDGDRKGLVNINDYANNIYIQVDVTTEVVTEGELYNLLINMDNVFGYDAEEYSIFVACYDKDGVLVDLISRSALLETSYSENISLDIPDKTDKIKLFIWKDMIPVYDDCEIASDISNLVYEKFEEETFIPCDSEYILYGGRWKPVTEDGTDMMRANWTRSYIRLKVSGDDVKIHFKDKTVQQKSLYVNGKCLVDLGLPNHISADGTLNLSKTAWNADYLNKGMNEIMILFQSESTADSIIGVTVGAGTTVYKPEQKELNMLFTGASYTSATFGYALKVPMMLDADFTTLSKSGIALRDGVGSAYWHGVESMVNMYGTVQKGAEYSESGDLLVDPDIYPMDKASNDLIYSDYNINNEFDFVIVTAGANDRVGQRRGESYVSDEEKETNADALDFSYSLCNYLKHFKEKYPNAKILYLEALVPREDEAAKATRQYLMHTLNNITPQIFEQEGLTEENGYYWIDTSHLKLDYYDTLHPTDLGHQELAEYIVDYLKDKNLVD